MIDFQMQYKYLNYKGKRPQNSKQKLRNEIIFFIKKETKKGYFPSKRELQNKFHCGLIGKENGIKELYAEAGTEYKLAPDQNEKVKKATMLLQIILEILPKFNCALVQYKSATETGIDIITKKEKQLVGIELKAYNSGERVKTKDLLQVRNAIIKENLSKAIIITTTDKVSKIVQLEKEIEIITYSKLIELIGTQKRQDLEYIRNSSVNKTSKTKPINRQKILDFVLSQSQLGIKPTYNIILKELHLDLYTYFDNLFEIYKKLELLPPTKNMRGLRAKNPDKELIEFWKTKFKEYIKENSLQGRYPSGEEIGKKFGIPHIWNITKVSELYTELGLSQYRKRYTRK